MLQSHKLHLVARVIEKLSIATAVLLLPMLILTRVTEIVVRGGLNLPGSLYNAMEKELFIAFVFMSLAGAVVRNAHVRVDIFRDRFSPRLVAAIEWLGLVFLVLPFGAVVLWYGVEMSYQVYASGERAAVALGAPVRWIIVATVPVGIGLFCLATLVRAVICLQMVSAGAGAGAGAGPAPDERRPHD